MDMCTEKDNEELMVALITAARAAFLSLKETTKEHFYFYVFVFDEGMHPIFQHGLTKPWKNP